MNIEEAIHVLKENLKAGSPESQFSKALTIAIKALENATDRPDYNSWRGYREK